MTFESVRRHEVDARWSAAEIVVALIAFAIAVTAITALTNRPSSTMALVAAGAFFTLVPGTYIALGIGGVRHALGATASTLPTVTRLLVGPVVLLIVIGAYAWASGLPLGPRLAIYGAYLLLPPLLLAIPDAKDDGAPRAPTPELLVALALWLPIEWRLLPALPLPAPDGVDMRKLVGLVDGMYLFLIARPLSRIGYTYGLSARDVSTAVFAFLAYAVVALPIGFATGFIAWRPELDATRVVLAPLVIYLVTGVPEEFLFRGLLQNLLTRLLGARTGLVIASVVFGLAHLPDPRYVVLAAIAGLAYGWVYQRTERISASAITHALVDAVWGAALGG